MARKSRNKKRAGPGRPQDDAELSHRLAGAVHAYEQGDLETAAGLATEILSRHPKHIDSLHLLGLTALKRGELEDAIASIEKAVSLGPRGANLHTSLGIALRMSGDPAAAERSLATAVKLKSDYVDAWDNLGVVRQMLGRYEDAAAAFEKALRFEPDSANLYNSLGLARGAMGRLSDAIGCFQQALRLDPDHAHAHENLGNALVELDHQQSEQINLAVESYQNALRRMPGRIETQRSLSYLSRRVVPQWHFPMLNNAARNEAYDEALRALVCDGDVVLDIGTGSGLLAMMAARAGASRVVSCESVKLIADKAKEIVSANGFDERVVVINKQSNLLRVGEDLPRPADILVAEIFDTGLIGEGALRSIQHAKQSLLKPDAITIPGRAIVYGAIIESESIHNLDRVNEAGGFDVSLFNEFSTHPAYLQQRLDAHAHRQLCDTFEVFEFDFQAETPFSRTATIPVEITQAGLIHGIAFWFDLYLTDDIVFSTAPSAGKSHWEQAIDLLATPRTVTAGEELQVAASHEERAISFRIE